MKCNALYEELPFNQTTEVTIPFDNVVLITRISDFYVMY